LIIRHNKISLAERYKADDPLHMRNADRLEIDSENIALQITADCIAVVIIHQDSNADECQRNGDDFAIFPYFYDYFRNVASCMRVYREKYFF
jgi:hypothetical protein